MSRLLHRHTMPDLRALAKRRGLTVKGQLKDEYVQRLAAMQGFIEEKLDVCCTRVECNDWNFFAFEQSFTGGNDATFKLCLIAWTFLAVENAKETLMFLRVLLVDILYRHVLDTPYFHHTTGSVR